MHALRTLLIGFTLMGATPPLEAGPIFIPSDVSVSLTAEPNAELQSGDAISFTISVTNRGPEPVDRFVLGSSPIYDELDVLSATIDCNYHLVLAVTDLENGFYYTYTWAVLLPGDPPLQVGETRYCYFTVPYTPWAPSEFPITFSTGSVITDLDPSNNSATVTLRREAAAAPVAVPALSPRTLLLLAVLLLVTVWTRSGSRPRTSTLG